MKYLEPQPRFDYVTQQVRVEPTSSPDLEGFLSIADIKEYLAIDEDNSDADEVLISSRASNFSAIRNFLNRAIVSTEFTALYKSVDSEVLLPFYPATAVTEVSIDGEVLDPTGYELFAGSIEFKNGGISGNITIQYTGGESPEVNILNELKRMIGIDYDNTDPSQKNTILKTLIKYKYKNHIA